MNEENAKAGSTLLRRTPVLDALREKRLTRSELEDRFDVARSTAYRTTIELQEQGLIEQRDSRYGLTPLGSAIVETSERYVELLAAAEHLQPVLALVDHPAFVNSLHLFTDATVMMADADDPFRLIDWFMDRLADADRYRNLVVTVGHKQHFEIAAKRADTGANMEVVFTPDALARSMDVAPELLASALRRPTCNAFVTEDVPFSLTLFDDTVAVVGIDDRTGLPGVCVTTDRADTWHWADALYRRSRHDADPVDAAALAG